MGTRVTYVVLGVCVLVISSLSFGAPLIVPQCNIQPSGITHLNPDYITDPCWHKKRWILLGMSSWDADMNVRIVMSLACGSLIGFERRRADRAAGIRTMALVCLGACVFTVASIFAFIDGPMAWDAVRYSELTTPALCALTLLRCVPSPCCVVCPHPIALCAAPYCVVRLAVARLCGHPIWRRLPWCRFHLERNTR